MDFDVPFAKRLQLSKCTDSGYQFFFWPQSIFKLMYVYYLVAYVVAQMVKDLPAMQETQI